MKNVTQFNTKQYCYNCKKDGFYCYTPCGADYRTCPLCDSSDDFLGESEEHQKRFEDLLNNYNSDDDIRTDNLFCTRCRIMYKLGCTHAANGCTDDTYSGHFIGKYEYNGNLYIGMPQFDSIDEWFDHANEIKILEWICPNNGIVCTKAYYPIEKHHDQYSICRLKK